MGPRNEGERPPEKADLKLKGIGYAGRIGRLEAAGIDENEANIRNKFSRGKFGADFVLQCLNAIN